MIIPKDNRLSPEKERELEAITGEFGISLHRIVGDHRTIYAMVGDERHELLITRLEGLDYVERVDTIQTPYKLMAKDSELANHRIRINGTVIGAGFTVIAGHCTIDPKNPSLFLESAQAVKEAGADMLRGGVWKPRTSPHSYQGDARALDILMEAKARTGLAVDTEVMDTEQLQLALDAGVDMLQVGARNALNYGLLRDIGRSIKNRPTAVLLKRGMHMGKLEEFILAAEYIAAQGNPNIVLCPRGTTPTMDGYRNHPDESITVLLKEKTWAPVIVDPSHSVGKAAYVPFACMAAAAYGAHGLIVETHVNPKAGIGDDPKQAVTPDVLARIIRDARAIHAMQAEQVQELAQAS
ncbi:MAG: 3-deoxy-D-arabino-heptulosonate 7-phosphate synthase [Candidatus Lambdaproteobacteria bacterium]|nr:3-deoxy-D-arabino-heptulosonate 7-phosphate synthase [Candidatus Lambdaproteobacteria bacterium]